MDSKSKSLAQELEQVTNKYRALYENSPDMQVSVSPVDTTIKVCNNTLTKKTGYSKKEVIGKPVFFMYHPDCHADVERAFQSFVETGHVENAELILKRKDGSKIPVLLNVEAVKDANGEILYSNSCWRDISEIKYLKQELSSANQALEIKIHQLEQKNKEVEQFAYVASHDLQEPLRTVVSFIELLEDETGDALGESAQTYLKFISESSQRMQKLIHGLLEFSRLGNERTLSEVDCNDLAKAVVQDLSSAIKTANAEVNIGKLPSLKASELELQLMLQNLISNAIKFRKPEQAPVISITADRSDQHWVFHVADNGIGIAPQHQDKVFSIFQRLHTQEAYSGTGIGLAHCKKIAGLHGGTVWFDSEPGQGSTFHFSISAAPH